MGTEEDVVSSPPQSWQQTVWASSPPTAGSPLPLATHAQGEREEQRSRRQLRLFVQRANAARVPPPAWCGCWWASVCSIGLIWAGLLPRLPWVLLPMGLPDNCAKLIVTSTNSLPSLSKRKKNEGSFGPEMCLSLRARALSQFSTRTGLAFHLSSTSAWRGGAIIPVRALVGHSPTPVCQQLIRFICPCRLHA
jgi:hypothetical protein